MIVCIPTMSDSGMDAEVGAHFGRSPYFTFVDTSSGEVRVVENSGTHHGGARTPAQLIVDEGPEVLLCSGLGRRAVAIFSDNGVAVYRGAQGTARQAVEDFQAGRLEAASEESACAGHGHGHPA